MANKETRFTLPGQDWYRSENRYERGKKSVENDLEPYKKMYPTKKFKVKAVQGPVRKGVRGRPFRIFMRDK